MKSFKRTVLSALTLALIGLTACNAASQTHSFELLTPQVSEGPAAEFSVKLVDKATGKPVAATIESAMLDMGPDGMAAMKEPAESLPSTEPGVFKFKANLSMAGRWAVHLKAKLPDGTSASGDLILTAISKGASASPLPDGNRKVAYYRNPMGLPDKSDVPKKDSMGMDYIPVYEDEASHPDGTITLSPAKIQRSGVRTEAAQLRRLTRPIRAPAVATIDERTMRDVTLRADGFIEKLYVAEEGKHVKEGDPLFRVYSPEIVKAEVDFRTARGASRLEGGSGIEGAVQRLENLDVPRSFIEQLKTRTGGVMPTQIDWPSPVSGVIMQKNIIEGQKVSAGDLLYRIADLSKIWVIASVSEQDIGAVKRGAMASVIFRAYPNEVFKAPVTFILHELDMATRTAKVRIEVANPDHRILHDMFADVTIEAGDENPRLSVPLSAIVDTGTRQIVLVDKGEGRFEQREVKLGVKGDGYLEIADGLSEGDNVVTAANFLIDSESNLRAALSSFDQPSADKRAETATP
jgi:Cu(I)/Ag(I) efflux system membrane fusion protein